MTPKRASLNDVILSEVRRADESKDLWLLFSRLDLARIWAQGAPSFASETWESKGHRALLKPRMKALPGAPGPGSPATGSGRWGGGLASETWESNAHLVLSKVPMRRAVSLPLVIVALALAGCRPHDFPQYPPNYREYAYVTNGASGTVSIYDVVNVRLDRVLPVGLNPVAVTASPTRNEVYVVNEGSSSGQGSVSVINTENNTIAASIPVGGQPVALALSADYALAYVANSRTNSISVLDLETRRIARTIGAGEQPVALHVSPDNKTLVIANRQGNSVSIIDPATGMLRAVFSGCPGASDVAILPDSSKAFAACSGGHQVMAIALARPAAHPAQPDRLESLLDVGRDPVQLALKPDGGEIFVLNSLSDSISEVITSTNDVLGAYLMGDDPVRGLVSADNSLLYVGNLNSQKVTIYSIDDGKRVGAIQVGDGPSALAFSAAGNLLFVVDSRSGDVAVVRTALIVAGLDHPATPSSLFTVLPTGRAPNAIAVKSFKLQ